MNIDYKELFHGHIVISTAHDFYFINLIPFLIAALVLAIVIAISQKLHK
jgi:hypothetical protein